MIARSVTAAADVIHRAQVNGTQTATGIALALESARLLMSPETAAELAGLRDRVADLEAERHSTNEALDDAVQALRADRGQPTAPDFPHQQASDTRPADEDPITYILTPEASCGRALASGRACPDHPQQTDDVTPQVLTLRALLAGQREQTTAAQGGAS